MFIKVIAATLRKLPRSKSMRFHFYRQNHTETAPVVSPVDKFSICKRFPEQTVAIRTCGNIYEEWRKEKQFFRIPQGDLEFKISYIDTEKESISDNIVDSDAPVVLALHGAPGSYTDFGLLTSSFWEKGFRVIAPSFPDFSVYPPGIFRHSAMEKAQLIKDFLKAIHISSIDLLICHSSAVYPGLQLCCDLEDIHISSLALLNPGAYVSKMSATKFFRHMKVMVKLCEFAPVLEVFKVIGPSFVKYFTPVKCDSFLDPLLSCTVMCYADFPKARENLHLLSGRNFPVFLAFSEDDKLIPPVLSYQIAYKLGIQDDKAIGFVSADNEILKEGYAVKNIRAMSFEKGSHYVFSRHPEIIHEEIHKFLQKFVL